jgi:hypothetical protein
MTVFKNLERFKRWYKQNYKGNFENLNWDAVLDEVVEQHFTKGDADYEMSGFDTKSGNPEVYCYDIDYNYDKRKYFSIEEATDYGDFERIIIF